MKPQPTFADAATIQRTITTALSMRHGRTSMTTLADLDGHLRRHIASLLPEAEEAADALWRGSIDWSRQAGVLDAIREHTQPLPTSPLSALADVEQRARHCQWLLDQHAPPV
ncbi:MULTISPECIES: DUF6415 family natural product biosynthesis protein [Streptomyces]|uniref:Uncharacterized protein n=2 Tax=Streptomyces rimosus subsp. rimosus TaxID=132474 RepID=L8EYM6_STRR1|nr:MULTISPECIES: DUF6415 family natural product biosynthesis protein [Streptomyces]KOG70497.1 hypothetical protein ADK78_28285 [Kitasatospora aureofaciens]MYT47266.1 hypothetical protein [Streptomyces sp. SID5471]KEF04600.1 hypothetical protein DF17_22155 [Streptomyces rimosus]KEF19974.1 hypothetical protein DF18_14220 [Streptomyces rimosus]KOT31329.1 hypothetical protein ADK84_29800 [Streptomyces sp. NRRL WC-3701]